MAKPTITRIEALSFEYELPDIGREPTIAIPIYKPGNTLVRGANAIRVHTDEGITGEYVGGNDTEYAGLPMFAPSLIGRGALGREEIYNDAKQAVRQHAGMGPRRRRHGAVGPRRQVLRRPRLRAPGRLSQEAPLLRQHLRRRPRERRPGQSGGVRRLRGAVPGDGLPRLQDSRLGECAD